MPEEIIDIDTGRFRLKFRTLMTIIGAIVAVVVAAVTWGVGTATKADVESVMAKHSMTPHANEKGEAVSAPASIVPEVKANTAAIKDVSSKVEIVQKTTDEGKEERRYIRARLDFLTEQAIIEGQQSPQARSHVRRAARNVRNAARAAGDTDDPLEGVNGL